MEKITEEQIIERFGQRAIDALPTDATNPTFFIDDRDQLCMNDDEGWSYQWDPDYGEWDAW